MRKSTSWIIAGICACYLAMMIGQRIHATGFKYGFLGFLFLIIIQNALGSFYEKFKVQGINKRGLAISSIVSVALVVAAHNYVIPWAAIPVRTADVTVTALGQKNSRSASTEVWILGITNKGIAYDLKQYAKDSTWKLSDNALVCSQNQPASINISFQDPSGAAINFLKHSWSGKVKVSNGAQTEVIDLYDTVRDASYKYDVSSTKTVKPKEPVVLKALNALLTFLFFVIVVYHVLFAFTKKR